MVAEINGPYERNYLVVDGFDVPDITVNAVKNPQGDIVSYEFIADNRFSLPDVPPVLFNSVAWFIANAMAVAAGYSCHGENSVENPNPYKKRVIGLSGL